METPKISIIVPIYRVEKYLRKCIESILHQTYENLDIILVDDGSPDQCGAICEEYAALDQRIQVIHQENGGVASARNAGLAQAHGEWIGWVDPDDWIELDMYETMLTCALSHQADIVVCGRWEEYRKRTVFYGWEKEETLDRVQAMEKLLQNNQLQNYVWDKLWRRSLFEGITFPVGKTFEDVAVIHRLFEQAETVVCLPKGNYHYVKRPESIVSNVSLKNQWNYYMASKTRYEEMKATWPPFEKLLGAQCAASTIGIWSSYYSASQQEREKIRPFFPEMTNYSKKYASIALKYIRLSMAGKVVLRLTPYATWWSFALSNVIGRLGQWKHRLGW